MATPEWDAYIDNLLSQKETSFLGELSDAVKRGALTTVALPLAATGYIGNKLGSETLESLGNEAATALLTKAFTDYAPAVGSYKDVLEEPSLTSALYYIANLGEFLPTSIGAMGAGALGSAIAKRILLRKGLENLAARALAKRVAIDKALSSGLIKSKLIPSEVTAKLAQGALESAMKRGAIAGAGTFGSAIGLGDIQATALQAGQEPPSPIVALPMSLLYSATEFGPELLALSRLGLFGRAANKGLLKTIAKKRYAVPSTMALQGALGGAGEVAQDYMTAAAVNLSGGKAPYPTAEQSLNTFVLSALGEALPGGVSELYRNKFAPEISSDISESDLKTYTTPQPAPEVQPEIREGIADTGISVPLHEAPMRESLYDRVKNRYERAGIVSASDYSRETAPPFGPDYLKPENLIRLQHVSSVQPNLFGPEVALTFNRPVLDTGPKEQLAFNFEPSPQPSLFDYEQPLAPPVTPQRALLQRMYEGSPYGRARSRFKEAGIQSASEYEEATPPKGMEFTQQDLLFPVSRKYRASGLENKRNYSGKYPVEEPKKKPFKPTREQLKLAFMNWRRSRKKVNKIAKALNVKNKDVETQIDGIPNIITPSQLIQMRREAVFSGKTKENIAKIKAIDNVLSQIPDWYVMLDDQFRRNPETGKWEHYPDVAHPRPEGVDYESIRKEEEKKKESLKLGKPKKKSALLKKIPAYTEPETTASSIRSPEEEALKRVENKKTRISEILALHRDTLNTFLKETKSKKQKEELKKHITQLTARIREQKKIEKAEEAEQKRIEKERKKALANRPKQATTILEQLEQVKKDYQKSLELTEKHIQNLEAELSETLSRAAQATGEEKERLDSEVGHLKKRLTKTRRHRTYVEKIINVIDDRIKEESLTDKERAKIEAEREKLEAEERKARESRQMDYLFEYLATLFDARFGMNDILTPEEKERLIQLKEEAWNDFIKRYIWRKGFAVSDAEGRKAKERAKRFAKEVWSRVNKNFVTSNDRTELVEWFKKAWIDELKRAGFASTDIKRGGKGGVETYPSRYKVSPEKGKFKAIDMFLHKAVRDYLEQEYLEVLNSPRLKGGLQEETFVNKVRELVNNILSIKNPLDRAKAVANLRKSLGETRFADIMRVIREYNIKFMESSGEPMPHREGGGGLLEGYTEYTVDDLIRDALSKGKVPPIEDRDIKRLISSKGYLGLADEIDSTLTDIRLKAKSKEMLGKDLPKIKKGIKALTNLVKALRKEGLTRGEEEKTTTLLGGSSGKGLLEMETGKKSSGKGLLELESSGTETEKKSSGKGLLEAETEKKSSGKGLLELESEKKSSAKSEKKSSGKGLLELESGEAKTKKKSSAKQQSLFDTKPSKGKGLLELQLIEENKELKSAIDRVISSNNINSADRSSIEEQIKKYGREAVSNMIETYATEKIAKLTSNEDIKNALDSINRIMDEFDLPDTETKKMPNQHQVRKVISDIIKKVTGRDVEVNIVDYVDVTRFPELKGVLMDTYGFTEDQLKNGNIAVVRDRVAGLTQVKPVSNDNLKILVEVAYKVSHNMVETAYHESFHILESLGLFTEEEIDLFKKRFGEKWQEKAANEFGKYAAGKLYIHRFENVFKKVKNFFIRLWNKLTGLGVKDVTDVYEMIYRGKFAYRKSPIFAELETQKFVTDWLAKETGYTPEDALKAINAVIKDYEEGRIHFITAVSKIEQLAIFADKDIDFFPIRKTDSSIAFSEDFESFGRPHADGPSTELLVNPSKSEIKSLFMKSMFNDLRVLVDTTKGDIYVWDAAWKSHEDIRRKLNIPASDVLNLMINEDKRFNSYSLKDLDKIYGLAGRMKERNYLQLLEEDEVIDNKELLEKIMSQAEVSRPGMIKEPNRWNHEMSLPYFLGKRNRFIDSAVMLADESMALKESLLSRFITTTVKSDIEEAEKKETNIKKQRELMKHRLFRLDEERLKKLIDSGILFKEFYKETEKGLVPRPATNEELEKLGLDREMRSAYWDIKRTMDNVIKILGEELKRSYLIGYRKKPWYPQLKQALYITFEKHKKLRKSARRERIREELKALRDEMAEVLDDKEMKAFSKDYRNIVRRYLEINRSVGNMVRGFFFPRMRHDGRFIINVVKKGTNELVYSYITKRKMTEKQELAEARKVIKELIEEYPSNEYEVKAPIRRGKYPEAMLGEVTMRAMSSLIEAAAEKIQGGEYSPEFVAKFVNEIRTKAFDELKSVGKGSSHLIRREKKHIKGYIEDNPTQVFFDYLNSMANLIGRIRFSSEIHEVLDSIQRSGRASNGRLLLPETYNYVKRYSQMILTPESHTMKAVNALRSFAFMMYMGLVMRMPIVQLTQNYVTAVPILSRLMKELGAKGSATKVITKALNDIKSYRLNTKTDKLTDDEKELLKLGRATGRTEAQFVNQVAHRIIRLSPDVSYRNKAAIYYNKIVDKMATPFAISEEVNREAALLAYYRVMKQVSPETTPALALDKGKRFIYDTHYLMGKANMPGIIARNEILRLAYTFKQFPHNYIASMLYFLRDYNGNLNIKYADVLAKSLFFIMLFGGMSGLPLVNDLLDFLESETGVPYRAKFIKMLRGKDKSDFFADLVMFGVPSILGTDISSSLRIEIPTTPKELIGVYGSVSDKWFESLKQAGMGDMDSTLENISPSALSYVLKAYRLMTEGATSKSGKRLFDYDRKPIKYNTYQAFLQALGIKPLYMGKRSLYRREQYLTDQYFNTTRSRIYELQKERYLTRNYKKRHDIAKTLDRLITEYNVKAARYNRPLVSRQSLKRVLKVKPDKVLHQLRYNP